MVIGGGGGTKLISPVAAHGKKVAAIEKEALGGTCLNRGCIPSKMLIHPADVAHEIENAQRFDIKVNTNYTVNWKHLVERVSDTVDKTAASITESYTKNPNIDFYHGTATFVSNKVIEVNGEQLTADNIIIAVGARPRIPNIPGLAGTPFMTSREAVRNTTQPKKLIIIGGGYIGVELGHFYGNLGTEVTFIVRSEFITKEDWQIQEEFTTEFSKRHTVHLNAETTQVSYKNNQFTVTILNRETNEQQKLTADALLVAVGITPNNDTLQLENTSIKINDRGFIQTNERLQTTVDGVYAIGDCNGRYFFRHSVNYEGEWLFNALYKHPHNNPIVYPPMPHAIFSNPQIAGVGVTEDELKAQHKYEKEDYIVGINYYKNSAMGDALRSDYGFVKLLFDAKNKTLIGAHIIGPEASDMIHMCIAYITLNATLDDMLHMIYIHPALPENVRNACRNAQKIFDEQHQPQDTCD
ncbi:MAG: dihydrolipoamide dehydrogenase [Candidatus Magasanikbacteria bacterium CG10_big_fil_rev_8_21_14_0_10_38_6]|uniref:Dihydrolipoamide dehydrogenase n=1 Tax=Candidatus Magasanikbacteria bacterium CG10_big_fil_rev_8_21_14_0_10_38_6 TaxID=1974647 RepID=A0A2M6P0U3_9BACT|nr:MAG: dihydrolipoamide dehydrogenase [Candidatus Magasanikbacteria bacterium CG10_big_fil_rev_8_21_14_0_10_38_6]